MQWIMHKNMTFYSLFHQSSSQQKSGLFFLIIGMMYLQKKYYFHLEFCDSTFSLLSRAPEYINKTEVLQNLVFRAYEQINASDNCKDSHVQLTIFYLYLYKSYIGL